MPKVKTIFFCQNCGAQYSKWQGQCNACKSWNTIVEEAVQTPKKGDWRPIASSSERRLVKPLKVSEIESA